MNPSAVTLEDSLLKLRSSVRALEKVCIKKENDLRARQQDLFQAPDAPKDGIEGANVVKLDMSKITQKLDQTIAQVEQLLKDEA